MPARSPGPRLRPPAHPRRAGAPGAPSRRYGPAVPRASSGFRAGSWEGSGCFIREVPAKAKKGSSDCSGLYFRERDGDVRRLSDEKTATVKDVFAEEANVQRMP